MIMKPTVENENNGNRLRNLADMEKQRSQEAAESKPNQPGPPMATHQNQRLAVLKPLAPKANNRLQEQAPKPNTSTTLP